MWEFAVNFLDLFQESAPWLLLGLLIAGIMKWLVPIELLKKHVGKDDLFSVIKAAFIGAPLPLCSCGVIPAAIGLRRAGASKPATVSFLVATPETGVDSISVSYALLGPFIAVIRPIAAILSAIYIGLLTLLFANKVNHYSKHNTEAVKSCCSKPEPEPVKKSCCASKNKLEESSDIITDEMYKTDVEANILKELIGQKIIQVLSFSSGKLLSDITRWLLLGLLLAAVIKTWVPTDFLTQWGNGFTAMLVMALIGIPMYICATASTPIAAGFLAVGVSPGAVLVFMLAGPATNLSTMGMIRQEMGNAVLVTYLAGILSASIMFGYLTNWAVAEFSFEIYQVASSNHHMEASSMHSVSAWVLGFLMLRNVLKKAIAN